MPDDYYKGVGGLAPTDGIKDPQVRAFCDSLANVWQLRNGNSGSDDKQRFITKQEWDFLAKNPNIRALAGIGQPGSSTLEPGPGDSAGPTPDLPDWIQNLVDFLAAGITLVDFTNVYKISNELFANYFAITSEFRNEITNINNAISDLENDITQINTITEDSESRSAQTLFAVKEEVGDATSAIIQINYVHADSTSANAKQTAALVASVDNIGNDNLTNSAAIAEINNVSATTTSVSAQNMWGMQVDLGYNQVTKKSKATADIVEINKVEASDGPTTSASANKVRGMSAQVNGNLALITSLEKVVADNESATARALSGVMAYSGLKARVFAQPNEPVSDATYTLVPGDLWIDTANDNLMKIRNVTNDAWVDASDKRIAGSSSGFAQEIFARTTSDQALAQQLNYLWAQVGNTNALVYGENIVQVNPFSGTATKFEQVYVAMPKGANGFPISAASQTSVTNYINANENRASSHYSLKVEAQAGGVLAATGMILSAEVNQGQPQSAVVFRADKFAIYHPNNSPSYIFPPFLVSNGVVRMNLAWINDRIQSDNFVSSFNAQGAYVGPGTGWVIRQNGNAEFHGTVLSARIYSGSVIVDRNSNQELYALAIGTWVGFEPLNAATQVWSVNTRMYGPSQHASVLKQQRVRTGSLVFTVTFMGVADHAVSIWWRKNGGGWSYLNTTTTPSDDVGAVTVGLNQTISVANNDFIDFGVSATYGNLVVANPAKPNIQNWNLSVTATNL